MSHKKYFSLIYGGDIHVAPETKVIPAETFSELMDSKEMIKRVQDEAEKYKIEVAAECEKIKEETERQGFYEGFKQWAAKVAEFDGALEREREEMKKNIIPIALSAAKKIVGRELELSESAIVDIVSASLQSVSQHKEITIYVHKNDYVALDKNKEHLKKIFEDLELLVIRERPDIEEGGCVIETEAGIINAQISNRWHVLEQAFEKMLSKRQKQPETVGEQS